MVVNALENPPQWQADATLIAIDPGAVSGALAVFNGASLPYVEDIPVVNGQIDAAALARFIRRVKPRLAVVERVGSMPKQGVASTFKFGTAVGIIHGVLGACEVPMHLVTPGVWKKAVGLIGQPKDAARAMAIRLFPAVTGLERVKDQGRADALLMGLWFKNGEGRRP